MVALLHPNGPFHARPAPAELVAALDVPPYHVIQAGEVGVRPATTDSSVATSLVASVNGRYTTRSIPKGTVLTGEMHADATRVPGLNERRIVTLRVLAHNSSLSTTLPVRVSLMAATTTETAECPDAYVMEIRNDAAPPGALATVALPSCTPAQVNALLSARTVTLVWAQRP